MDPGVYFAVSYHDGLAYMSEVSFFAISGFQGSLNGHQNKFYLASNLISNENEKDSVYRILFNPVTCEIKLNSSYGKKYLFIKFQF